MKTIPNLHMYMYLHNEYIHTRTIVLFSTLLKERRMEKKKKK